MNAASNLPLALRPIYVTSAINAPIPLYKGKLEAESARGIAREASDGELRFLWTPTPSVVANLVAGVESLLGLGGKPIGCKLLEINREVQLRVIRVHSRS